MRRYLFIRRFAGRESVKSERGATLVEFAVTSILFFLLIFGILEFGRAIWLYGSIAHGAREGARHALVRGTESGRTVSATDVETFVRNHAPGLETSTVTTSWSPASCGSPVETPCKQPGSIVSVRVQLTFDPVIWFMPPIPISTTSAMVISF